MTIYREHTELQVMAERFRQIADALERSERSARADAVEALEVHRRFLVGVHHRREAIVSAEVRDSVDPTVRAALARCAADHPAAERFHAEASSLLREAVLSRESAHRLAGFLRTEADRVVEHHRWEGDAIYHKIRPTLSAATLARLREKMEPLVGEADAAHTRLISWSSHANPAAD